MLQLTLEIKGHEYHWGVNHLSHFVMTQLLMPLLLRGAPDARIITLSSLKHKKGHIHWEDPDFAKSSSAAAAAASAAHRAEAGDVSEQASNGGNKRKNAAASSSTAAPAAESVVVSSHGSRGGGGGDSYDACQAFNQSKLANVLFTRELARRQDGTGVNS